MSRFTLVHQTKCWRLTWAGRIVLLTVLIGLLLVAKAKMYPFLAINQPAPGNIMVIEGPFPEYAIDSAINEFTSKNYDLILTVGGPITSSINLTEFKTVPEVIAALFVAHGLDEGRVLSLPRPLVQTDRTYSNALRVRTWVEQSNVKVSSINIFSIGPHARRSRLLFEKALGDEIEVGVLAYHDINYRPTRWWKNSIGFRAVTGEALAYLYARFFFRK